MNKNKILLLVAIVLAVLAVMLITNHSNSTMSDKLKNFTVEDTASIQKIYMADKLNREVTLLRQENGDWIMKDSTLVRADLIKAVLVALKKVQAVAPVAKSAHDNVIRSMAVRSTKVEVYVKSYRINLFNKIKLFSYTKLEKSFYVGDPTQDHLGTFMLIENADTPFITYIPGFDGYLSTRYSANPDEWKTTDMIKYNFNDIKSVSVVYPKNPENSFEIERVAEKAFSLKSPSGQALTMPIDTVKILDFVTSFYKLNFEEFVGEQLKPKVKDSVLKSTPFCVITIKDINKKEQVLKTYHKANPYTDKAQYEELTEEDYDIDRLYALNNDKDFVVIQYFVFDRVFKKLNSFFVQPEQTSEKK